MHDPFAGMRFGDAHGAAIEQAECGIHRLADRAGGGGRDRVALVPGVFDDVCEFGMGHVRS